MWRYFVGTGAIMLLGVAGIFLFRSGTAAQPALAAPPPALATGNAEDVLPEEAPSASAKTREQKRFDRYDKDRNDAITREEYLLSRRKAFVKLDTDRDGKLGFEEWAVKTSGKFAGADKDKSGVLDRTEFVATAPKRRVAKPKCACPKPTETAAAEESED
ncbi:MAG: histidine kinase [Sphingomonadales bacterium]|nr:MAG: histidine kinase [Sphingomonadales bacterium]